jgi:hypothetical protein
LWGELSTAAFIDIATVYLESGNVEAAFSWVQKIPEDDTFKSYERDKLLRQIYERQGDEEKLKELLYRKFRSYHSMDTLQDLLNVIGENKREEVISDEIPLILDDSKLNYSDAEFLIEIGKMDEAEDYLIKRAGELDGHFYGSLLPLAERMAEENRNLAASLIYRCLLVSILERGYTKAYSHGIRYLKKLDKLARFVPDWMEFIDDKTFKDQLLQSHGRKRSFWSKYKPRN